MSRFAVLHDDDDLSDGVDSLHHLSPQYTRDEIIAFHQSASDSPPPTSLAKFTHVFTADFQPLECAAFRPPASGINSPAYQPRGRQPKPPVRPPGREPDVDLTGCWVYKDPMDRTIGPFPARRMREWLGRRLIDATLLVRPAASDGKFQRISVLFPDLASAFSDQSLNRRDSDDTERPLTLVSFRMSDDDNAWDVESP
jgi:hypothetical protein